MPIIIIKREVQKKIAHCLDTLTRDYNFKHIHLTNVQLLNARRGRMEGR